MQLYSIASGSSGNCIYVGSDTTHLLVDTGISKKRTEEGLNEIGVSLQDMDGILITHEHSDHIGGLGVISRKYHIPIYATKKTIDAIKGSSSLDSIDLSIELLISCKESSLKLSIIYCLTSISIIFTTNIMDVFYFIIPIYSSYVIFFSFKIVAISTDKYLKCHGSYA